MEIKKHLPLWLCVAAGVVFGFILRSGPSFYYAGSQGAQLLSWSFLFFGPFAMGALTVGLSQARVSWQRAFFGPWIAILAGCVICLAFSIEGWICTAMYLPLGLILSSVGGISMRAVQGVQRKMMLASILVLPFASHLVESQIDPSTQLKTVRTQVQIHASPTEVWREIKSVRTITADELPASWVHRMGFPRPLDAEINKEGLGGVRLARFERGLVFNEIVTEWSPLQKLGFDIHVTDVPPTALDEHVTIGGKSFDVLHGLYEIEPNAQGVLLKLSSEFRLTTNINDYAGSWTQLIMNQIQSDILSVVKLRAESSARP